MGWGRVTRSLRRAVSSAGKSVARGVGRSVIGRGIVRPIGRGVSTFVRAVGDDVIKPVTSAVGRGIQSGTRELGVGGELGNALNTVGHAVDRGGNKVGGAVSGTGQMVGGALELVADGDIADREARRRYAVRNVNSLAVMGQVAPLVAVVPGMQGVALAMSAASNYALSNAKLQSNVQGWRNLGTTAVAAATPGMGNYFAGQMGATAGAGATWANIGAYSAGYGAAGALAGGASAAIQRQNILRGATIGGIGGALGGAAQGYLAGAGMAMPAGELSEWQQAGAGQGFWGGGNATANTAMADANRMYALNVDWTGHLARGAASGLGTYSAARLSGASGDKASDAALIAGLGAGVGSYGTSVTGNAALGGAAGGAARYATGTFLGDDRDLGIDVVSGTLGGLPFGNVVQAGLNANQAHERRTTQQEQMMQRYQQQMQTLQQRRAGTQTGQRPTGVYGSYLQPQTYPYTQPTAYNPTQRYQRAITYQPYQQPRAITGTGAPQQGYFS